MTSRMGCDLAKHKNVFGRPRKGIQGVRLLGSPVFDVALTLIAAITTSPLFGGSLWLSLTLWLIAGALLHTLFHVDSRLSFVR